MKALYLIETHLGVVTVDEDGYPVDIPEDLCHIDRFDLKEYRDWCAKTGVSPSGTVLNGLCGYWHVRGYVDADDYVREACVASVSAACGIMSDVGGSVRPWPQTTAGEPHPDREDSLNPSPG